VILMIDTPASKGPEDEDDESRRRAWQEPLRQFALYSHVGIMFPVAIAIGFFGGYLLDGWLGSYPWCSLLGLVLGFVAATRNLLQTVSIDDDRNRRSE
jgi:F0F1-type ATP synthase assembly protein I